jgi:hypothetical protein
MGLWNLLFGKGRARNREAIAPSDITVLASPDGKVEDNGVFILSDWGSIETLNGTFAAFCPDGKPILSRKLKANLFNNGLSPDGRWAVCQTANAPSDDSGRLFPVRSGSWEGNEFVAGGVRLGKRAHVHLANFNLRCRVTD